MGKAGRVQDLPKFLENILQKKETGKTKRGAREHPGNCMQEFPGVFFKQNTEMGGLACYTSADHRQSVIDTRVEGKIMTNKKRRIKKANNGK